MSAFLMVELTMRSVESFRSSFALIASLTALLMSSRSMVASLNGAAGRLLVYRKIPRLYRGCARHATGHHGTIRRRVDEARNGRLSKPALGFGQIWPKTRVP